MPPRQVAVFRIGCWAAALAAVAHLAGHIAGPQAPVNDTERQLADLAATYRYALPGGASRSLMDFLNGFSLLFALFLATMAGVGLLVQKRAHHDGPLMLAVARAFAVSSVVMLVITLTHFFIVPALFVALVAVSFLVASVQPPSPEPEEADPRPPLHQ